MPKRQSQKKTNARLKTKTNVHGKPSKSHKIDSAVHAIDPYSKQNKRKIKSKTKRTSTHQYTFNDGSSYEDITIHEDKCGEWGGDIGSTVWKVSYLFSKHFERLQSVQQFVSNPNHLFLELGSGTGILGMVIGRMGGKIICSEQQHSMALLEMNLKANALYLKGMDCFPLHWGSHANYKLFSKKLMSFLNENSFFKAKDKKLYIVIADCIYLGALHALLLETIQRIRDAICTEFFVRGIKSKHNHRGVVEIMMAYQQRNAENERNFWKMVNAEYASWTYRAIEIEDEVKRTYMQCFNKIHGLNADETANHNDNDGADDEMKEQNADFITLPALNEFFLFCITPTSTM